MAFDLATAKPVEESGGFDLSTARPVDSPVSVGTKLQTGFLAQAKAPFDAATSLITGAVAAPVAGIAGLAQGAKNLVSPGMSAGERVNQVQGALTFQPRTEAGQTLVEVASFPFQKLAQGADYVGGAVAEASGSPALGAGVNTAIQAAPMVLSKLAKAPSQRMLAKAETKAADLMSINSVRDKTINDARALDYKFPPTEVRDTYGAARIESMGGKAAIGQQMNRHNQFVTDRIAREEAGLRQNQPLSLDTLKEARERLARPYRELEAVSPGAAADFKALQEARRLSKEQWEFFHRSLDPAVKAKAKAFDAEASRLETRLEQLAENSGQPGLVQDVRAARTALAKNYDVERALNLGDGHADARIWGRMLDHEKPLTGKLAVAARAAEAMGRFMKSAESTPTPGVSKLEWPVSMAMGAGGYATLGPGGAVLGAAPFIAPPVARRLAMSNIMQRPNTYAPGAVPSGLELLTRQPLGYAAIPAVGDNEGLAALLRR